MKNALLDELTDLAKDLADTIPSPRFGGDGKFYDEHGDQIPVESILSDMHDAKQKAEELHNNLRVQPRRKQSS